MNDLTLFTPTRNRPWAFSLLQTYVARQTIRYEEWIVCCDEGWDDYNFSMGQTVIRREDRTPEFQFTNLHSINANYLACLEAAQDAKKVLFVEDDDWLHPQFLETYSRWLDEADLVGVIKNRYYHVKNRAYCEMWNTAHSSLASTGITAAVLPLLREACLRNDPYIDMYLWKTWTGKKKLHADNHLHVGLKGVEGNPGYGIGHYLVEPVDQDGTVLRAWIGEDADNYEDILHTNRNDTLSAPQPTPLKSLA